MQVVWYFLFLFLTLGTQRAVPELNVNLIIFWYLKLSLQETTTYPLKTTATYP